MATRDPRIDAYIANAPAWAQPILRELRERVHATCPAVTETLKWRLPSFEQDGLLGGMAAFKNYCAFMFWKEKVLRADKAVVTVLDACARMTSVEDLPSKSRFVQALRRGASLNAKGVKVPRAKSAPKPTIAIHPGFSRALAASKRAAAQFAAFSPSAQREYLEWIADAKKDDTRERRIEQAVAWIAEGKRRNWKYEAR